MLSLSTTKQTGFTLVELMISIGLGIVAISSIMFFFLSTVTSSSTTLKKAKLNQEMATVMDLMTQEIRRVGVSHYTNILEDDPAANPFHSENYKLRLWSFSGGAWTSIDLPQDLSSDPEANCITFSYDHNLNSFHPVDGNPLIGEVEDSDLFGFRFLNGNVQTFVASGSQTPPHTCSSSSWFDLFDKSSVTITSLKFEMPDVFCLNKSEPDFEDDDGDGFDAGTEDENGNGIPEDLEDGSDEFDCNAVIPDSGQLISQINNVKIKMTAHLTEDSEITSELVQIIKVRNDRFYYAP